MRRILPLLLAVGLASPTRAQPGDRTYIDIKGRVKGNTDWVDSIGSAGTGGFLDIEIGVFYFRSDGVGLATVVHNMVLTGVGSSVWNPAAGDSYTILDRADSTQHPDGRQGNFNFGGQTQAGYTSENSATNDTGRLRIAAKNNTQDAIGGGISIKQNTPVALGAGFDTRDGVLGYRFDVRIAIAPDGSSRSFVVDSPKDRVNSFRAYRDRTTQEILPSFPNLEDTDVLNITAIPAPPAFAVAGCVLAVGLGRRRSRWIGRPALAHPHAAPHLALKESR